MKIVLLGGGTGGHFYPLLAVARSLRDIAEEERLVSLNITLMGDKPFDPDAMREESVQFEMIPAGKLRRYFSLLNITDSIKTIRGIFRALWKFTISPPDIIFSKGGYDAFPALVAARIYRIPVMIHESDAVPGAVNSWTAKFARRIGVSFPEAAKYFPTDKVALLGNPIRHGILGGSSDEAFDIFSLETGIPIVLILGGSQGAQKINDIVLSILAEMVETFQIIHSTGSANHDDVAKEAEVVLGDSPHKSRYHHFPLMTASQLRNSAFVANVAVSRAGAGSIFELAAWHLPAILVPITDSAQNHQRENAYSYARTGSAVVIEEANLSPHVLVSEIQKIITDTARASEMKQAAGTFARIDASRKIANELIHLGIHE